MAPIAAQIIAALRLARLLGVGGVLLLPAHHGL